MAAPETNAPGTLEYRALGHVSRTQIIVDTCQLIIARSENPGGSEAQTVRWLGEMCRRIGATVRVWEFAPGRENLHATLGSPAGPAILFLGHSDVVPAGEGWDGDPFRPRLGDDAIIGRGAADMKGGLAAVVAAMDAIHRVDPEIRLELLCTGDEEDRSQGIRAAMERFAERTFAACIVAEPTGLDVVIGCRGASNFHVQIIGASAHAGRPEDGANSIDAASLLIDLVRAHHQQAQEYEEDPLLGAPTWSIGTIQGGTATSMVPRETTVTIDRRTTPGEDPGDILERLLTQLRLDLTELPNWERFEVSGRVDMEMPGFRQDAGEEIVRVARGALLELGLPALVTGWTAACEGGFFARRGTPTIVCGPGDVTAWAHQPNERVSITELLSAAHAYVLMGLRLARPGAGRATGREDEREDKEPMAL